MTREDIMAMMQEAGLKAPARGDFIFIHWDQIALLIQHEREACAKAVEKIETYEKIEKACFKFAAKTIRARGEA